MKKIAQNEEPPSSRRSELQRPTLVLNRNWQPIHVATAARSLVLIWNEAAKVVDPADYQLYGWDEWIDMPPRSGEPFLRGANRRFRVPEVITLTRFDRVPAQSVTFSRRNVIKRDRYLCQYCGRRPKANELTIDHVMPRAQGGESTWTNCVVACMTCNASKANRTPKEASMRLRKQPVQPRWKPIYADRQDRLESWRNFVGPRDSDAASA